MDIIPHPTATRRIFLTGAGTLIGAFGVAPTIVLRPATATPSAMAAAIREVVGEAELHQGRVRLDKNPQPNVTIFHLTPRAGRARVSTRIRLANSQKVVAIARLSDDSFWYHTVDVMVTLAACLEDLG
jgi:sulfur-oxidizing protein SoxY